MKLNAKIAAGIQNADGKDRQRFAVDGFVVWCKQCGHVWTPSSDGKPYRCARYSCGSYRWWTDKPRAYIRHDHSHKGNHTAAYHAWQGIKSRTGNPNEPAYPHYGGRGITTCSRWSYFVNFLADMGEPPSPEHSIDRVDTNGNYEPTNCRWATSKQQQNNRRNNRRITHLGLTLTTTQWAESAGINPTTLRGRLNRGWSLTEALEVQP